MMKMRRRVFVIWIALGSHHYAIVSCHSPRHSSGLIIDLVPCVYVKTSQHSSVSFSECLSPEGMVT